MTKTTLASIATVVRGVSFDKSDVSDSAGNGLLPILRAGNIEVELDLRNNLVWVPSSKVSGEQLLKPGDIPICMSSGSPAVVGKSAILRNPWQGSVGAFCAVVRANSTFVLPEFLAFFLRSPSFRAWTKTSSGSSIKNIKKSGLEEYPLDLPGFEEQRRIVELLSRAESIVRLRREAQQKAAELVPAIFLEMFGDPRTNTKSLPVYALGDLMVSPPTLGTMAKPSENQAKWLDLRVANIQGGKLTLDDRKWLDLSEKEIDRFQLVAGDVVLARAIGSLDHLGKAVVVYPDSDWTFDSHLMRLRFDPLRLLPEWFVPYLSSEGGRAEFLKHTRHSAVQFNINGKEIRKLQIPLPTLEAQKVFCARTEEIRSITTQQAAATAKSEAVFQSLLSAAFKS